MSTIALIPARRGSKRLPGKNMALLNGQPLLQYAIESAQRGPGLPKLVDKIVVSSDWDRCLALAEKMGVTPLRRPQDLCQDASHDYEWVKHALDAFPGYDLFVILRPTSPFRTFQTVERAIYRFTWELDDDTDSMRAVEQVSQHPWKMWKDVNGRIYPYEQVYRGAFPAFDMGTQTFPQLHAQNGCIHVARTDNLTKYGNVSGVKIAPFFCIGNEGIDINNPEDLEYAEWLMQRTPISYGH